MKRLLITAIILISLISSSCEKVIDIKLDDADAKYVIEGVVADKSGVAQVRISRTKKFSDNNSFNGVSGAGVVISSSLGDTTILAEIADGIYEAPVEGRPGVTYTMNVRIEGAEFSAVSTMPQPVNIEDMFVTEMEMMGEKMKQVNVVFDDPAAAGNAYRFVQYINGEKDHGVFIRNDELSNGRRTTVDLFSHDTEINSNDTIRVELRAIDAQVYKFWFSLSEGSTGDTNTATPFNPVTNITGGALGYFSAEAVTESSTKS